MKINLKIGSFLLLQSAFVVNLYSAEPKQTLQEKFRHPQLEKPNQQIKTKKKQKLFTAVSSKQKLQAGQGTDAVLLERITKINKWTSPNFIDGDDRLTLLNNEFLRIRRNVPLSAKQGKFLGSWFNYLNHVFFAKPYSPERSKILKKFMNNYMQNVFKSFTGTQGVVLTAKRKIVEKYCLYLLKELKHTAKELVTLINSRTKKINNWTTKEQWWRITGTWLVPYKKMQAKYEYEVTQYETALNKIVDTLGDMQVFLCTNVDSQMELLESLNDTQFKLFSPEYDYAKTSITHAFIQLCLAWYRPIISSFLGDFFLMRQLSEKEKEALEHFNKEGGYRAMLKYVCTNFAEKINHLIKNSPENCETLSQFCTNIKTLFQKGITKPQRSTSLFPAYEKQNIEALISEIEKIIDENTGAEKPQYTFGLQEGLEGLESVKESGE